MFRTMSSRIITMRASLRQKLEELGTPGDWSHITTQIGMFSYTGLSQEMCVFLKQEKHLYLLKSGRISMCGVSERHQKQWKILLMQNITFSLPVRMLTMSPKPSTKLSLSSNDRCQLWRKIT